MVYSYKGIFSNANAEAPAILNMGESYKYSVD